MNKMPTVFISHGAPNMLLHGGQTHDFLQGLGKRLPTPKAILIASAHWETEAPMLSAHPHPELIYDFYGFEPEMYAMKYPVAGAPDVAAAASAAIPLSSIDPQRGLDHGAWSPLKIVYPDAHIPVLQLSVQPHLNAKTHYDTAQKLDALREQGVLIMGSGNATHNLRAAMRPVAGGTEKADAFAQWLHVALESGDHDTAKDWIESAPDAVWNHPTPEHFLPLFSALGAAGRDAKATRVHAGVEFNALAMDAYIFG